MFDELKEVKYIKKMKDLQLQWRAYLELKRASMIKLLCENNKLIKAVNYFCKKTASEMFNWVLNRPLKIMKFSRWSFVGANHRDFYNL